MVDNVSYDFVKGATVDYVEELIRSAFQVSQFVMLPLHALFLYYASQNCVCTLNLIPVNPTWKFIVWDMRTRIMSKKDILYNERSIFKVFL